MSKYSGKPTLKSVSKHGQRFVLIDEARIAEAEKLSFLNTAPGEPLGYEQLKAAYEKLQADHEELKETSNGLLKLAKAEKQAYQQEIDAAHAKSAKLLTRVKSQYPPTDNKGKTDFSALFSKGVTASELVMKEFLPEVWAVDGILIEGVTILAGAPKIKKSWWALGVCIAVATGGIALGHTQVEQGTALYLALEDREKRLQKRIKAVLGDTPASKNLHLFTEWPRVGCGCVEALDEWLTAHPGTRLVTIDTLKRIRPPRRVNSNPYDEDYDAIGAFTALSHKHHVAIVIVHHTRKGESEDIVEEISGTQGLAGSADSILIMKRERGAANAFLYVTGRDIEHETTYAMDWDERTCTWHIKGEGDQFKGTNEQVAILDLLRTRGPLLTLEICRALHGNDKLTHDSKECNNTNHKLHRLKTMGKIDKRAFDKRWCLPLPPKDTFSPEEL